jgi:hypothetical protein
MSLWQLLLPKQYHIRHIELNKVHFNEIVIILKF